MAYVVCHSVAAFCYGAFFYDSTDQLSCHIMVLHSTLYQDLDQLQPGVRVDLRGMLAESQAESAAGPQDLDTYSV